MGFDLLLGSGKARLEKLAKVGLLLNFLLGRRTGLEIIELVLVALIESN